MLFLFHEETCHMSSPQPAMSLLDVDMLGSHVYIVDHNVRDML